ncbi:MAG: hypothetical protein PF795_12145, partial [Kiritimatiellae bacterium]|nr:hypothetical protein [Kiritimatiellia bacterium]
MNRLWTILALCFWMTQQLVLASAGFESCDLKHQAEGCCCTVPAEPVSCCGLPVEKAPCTCHFEEAPEPMAPMETTQPSPRPQLPLLAVLPHFVDVHAFRTPEIIFHGLPGVGTPTARHSCALL